MAKRFTDSEKWKKQWYRALPLKMKCFWEYIRDQCDHAGIWDIDFFAAKFHIGQPFTEDEVLEAFDGRIIKIDHDKMIVRGFTKFQYKTLNPDNRVHKSVMDRLSKFNIDFNDIDALSKGLTSPMLGCKDKDKDKAKDKAKEKGKNLDFETLYQKYPKKIGKDDGMKKCRAQVKTADQYNQLKQSIENYIQYCQRKGTDDQYILKFSNFMKEWNDWVNPEKSTNLNKTTDEEWKEVFNDETRVSNTTDQA